MGDCAGRQSQEHNGCQEASGSTEGQCQALSTHKGWFLPSPEPEGLEEKGALVIEGPGGTKRTIRNKSVPKACPHCSWKGEFSWEGGGYVVCGYCMRKVLIEEVPMAYCPVCQCEVEIKPVYGIGVNDLFACIDCGCLIGDLKAPLPGPPPDGTMFQFNKEGTVGRMGWICPVCGAGVSPREGRCGCVPFPQPVSVTVRGVDFHSDTDTIDGSDYMESARHLSDP